MSYFVYVGPISTKHSMKHLGLHPVIGCSNDDPGLTLIHLTVSSKFVH